MYNFKLDQIPTDDELEAVINATIKEFDLLGGRRRLPAASRDVVDKPGTSRDSSGGGDYDADEPDGPVTSGEDDDSDDKSSSAKGTLTILVTFHSFFNEARFILVLMLHF